MKQFDIPEIIDDSFIIQFFSLQNTDKINPSRTKKQQMIYLITKLLQKNVKKLYQKDMGLNMLLSQI